VQHRRLRLVGQRQRALDLLRRRQQVLREDVEVVYRVFGHGKCLRKPASLTRRAP